MRPRGRWTQKADAPHSQTRSCGNRRAKRISRQPSNCATRAQQPHVADADAGDKVRQRRAKSYGQHIQHRYQAGTLHPRSRRAAGPCVRARRGAPGRAHTGTKRCGPAGRHSQCPLSPPPPAPRNLQTSPQQASGALAPRPSLFEYIIQSPARSTAKTRISICT